MTDSAQQSNLSCGEQQRNIAPGRSKNGGNTQLAAQPGDPWRSEFLDVGMTEEERKRGGGSET